MKQELIEMSLFYKTTEPGINHTIDRFRFHKDTVEIAKNLKFREFLVNNKGKKCADIVDQLNSIVVNVATNFDEYNKINYDEYKILLLSLTDMLQKFKNNPNALIDVKAKEI